MEAKVDRGIDFGNNGCYLSIHQGIGTDAMVARVRNVHVCFSDLQAAWIFELRIDTDLVGKSLCARSGQSLHSGGRDSNERVSLTRVNVARCRTNRKRAEIPTITRQRYDFL